MTNPTSFAPYDPAVLPQAVVRYLELQADPERRPMIADLFSPDGRVVDENVEYSGSQAIAGWLGTTASAYTYTTTLVGQQGEGDNRWTVTARLEGNFPGGVAELRYRFRTLDARIVELVIAP